MRKQIAVLLLGSMIAVAALTGCSKNESTSGTTVAVTTEANVADGDDVVAEEEAKTEVVVNHSKGATTAPVNPSKIVVFDMGVLDTLDALGVEVELALPVSSVPAYLSKYEDAVNAGGIKEPDLEAIFGFEPELMFVSGRQAEYYDELNEIAPTIYVDLDAANYMADFERNVRYIAEIFGKEEEAEAQLEAINTIVEEAQVLTADLEDRALILLTNDGNISAYGSGSRFGIIHDTLGVKPADEDIESSTHGQGTTYEYIADLNPDIIYVVDRTAVVGGSTDADSTLDNELVDTTNAAQNNKIVYLDAEMWYLAGGGLTSVSEMVEEAVAPLR